MEKILLFFKVKTKVNIAFFIKKWYNEGYEISRLHLGFRRNPAR